MNHYAQALAELPAELRRYPDYAEPGLYLARYIDEVTGIAYEF